VACTNRIAHATKWYDAYVAKTPTIDPARTWIISDTHWGHENIVEFCRRPADHEQVMIDEWRDVVPPDDTVLHLGDLSYRNNGMFRHVTSKQLTGSRKLLVKGNHDHSRPTFYRDSGFTVVRPFEMLYDYDENRPGDEAKRYVVTFSHYPLVAPCPRMRERTRIHIHGHIHNQGYGGYDTPFTPFSAGQINVSAEQLHYRPVNLKLLLDGYIKGCYAP
jgi:calcineurin-like phosphoesterase family protein